MQLTDPTGIEALPLGLLVSLAIEAGETEGYSALAEPGPGERSFACVLSTPAYDVWLIRWGPRSATALHDHGDSAGAVYVLAGELVEHVAAPDAGGLRHQTLSTFDHRAMDGEPLARFIRKLSDLLTNPELMLL